MIRRLKFNKEVDGWFADLPEWEGSRADLQMVLNADTWLDILCQGEWHVWVVVSDEPFEGAEKLIRTSLGCALTEEPFESGATYKIESYMGIEYKLHMWLCDVTKFVFDGFPEVIYYKLS
jgi:hypothetical protein